MIDKNLRHRFTRAVHYLIFTGLIRNQKDLAARIGVSRCHVSSCISGGVKITEFTVSRLCSHYKMLNRNYIMTGSGVLFNMSEQDLINQIRCQAPGISKSTIREISDIINDEYTKRNVKSL